MTTQEMETTVKALTAPGIGVTVNRAAHQGEYTAAMEKDQGMFLHEENRWAK